MPPSSTETTTLIKRGPPTLSSSSTTTTTLELNEGKSSSAFDTAISLPDHHQHPLSPINDSLSDICLKINGKWLSLSRDFVQKHPGGGVINQYKNADATHIFHAFHEGSDTAYKQLKIVEKFNQISGEYHPSMDQTHGRSLNRGEDKTLGLYDLSIEQVSFQVFSLSFEKVNI